MSLLGVAMILVMMFMAVGPVQTVLAWNWTATATPNCTNVVVTANVSDEGDWKYSEVTGTGTFDYASNGTYTGTVTATWRKDSQDYSESKTVSGIKPSNCTPPPLVCTLPQVLNNAGDACVTPPLVCTLPQVLNNAGDACVTPPLVCTLPQVLNNAGDACVTPPVVVPPAAPVFVLPLKPDVPGCAACSGTLTWSDMYPKADQLVVLFHLTASCVWNWDGTKWCNNTDANQVMARVSLKPFTVIWAGMYHPAVKYDDLWILSDLDDQLQGITIDGTYTGAFSWTDWPKLVRTADAGQKLQKYFVCTGPNWTNAGDVASWWQPYRDLIAHEKWAAANK